MGKKDTFRVISTETLIKFCQDRGLSSNDLARLLDVDPGYISRVLNDKRDGGKKLLIALIKLCQSEGLDVLYFFNIA